MSRIVGSRAPGAFLRACLVALLVALPQLVLGPGTGGPPQVVTLVALMAALFTLAEYAAAAPSLVEFRDAHPYNRLRVLAIALLRSEWHALPLAVPVLGLGRVFATVFDLPWSPVHLLLRTLPAGVEPSLRDTVFTVAAVAYGFSLLMVLAFLLAIRLRGWPVRMTFNVWVNLPQFDPTAGGDVVLRLQQNAVVNVSLGLFLPLIAPMVARLLAAPFDGAALADPAALVWVVIGWAFIPASLVMRGLALHRLAGLIAAHRARLRRRAELAQLA
jgi:hypothetical protein